MLSEEIKRDEEIEGDENALENIPNEPDPPPPPPGEPPEPKP